MWPRDEPRALVAAAIGAVDPLRARIAADAAGFSALPALYTAPAAGFSASSARCCGAHRRARDHAQQRTCPKDLLKAPH